MNNLKVLQKGSTPINNERVRTHIKVLLEDDDHGYNELYLVTNTETLFNTIIDCQLILKQSNSYSDTVYNEVINLVFRPKVTFKRICSGIMSYIGCNIDSDSLVSHILEYPYEPVFIVVHINIESDEYSSVGILPNFSGWEREDPYFKLTNNLDTSLCLPSRLQVLNQLEQVFLIRLVYELMELPTHSCRWTYCQLLDFFRIQTQEMSDDEMADYDINNDTPSGIVDTLLFYGLIDLEQEDINEGDNNQKKHYFIFSVRDLNLYYEFFHLMNNEQAA